MTLRECFQSVVAVVVDVVVDGRYRKGRCVPNLSEKEEEEEGEQRRSLLLRRDGPRRLFIQGATESTKYPTSPPPPSLPLARSLISVKWIGRKERRPRRRRRRRTATATPTQTGVEHKSEQIDLLSESLASLPARTSRTSFAVPSTSKQSTLIKREASEQGDG